MLKIMSIIIYKKRNNNYDICDKNNIYENN